MSNQKLTISAKAIEAAIFFADVLGLPTSSDEKGFAWEWWHGDDEDAGDGRPLGHWVRLAFDEEGELRATLICTGLDQSDQYALAGYCAVHGIAYTTTLAKDEAAESQGDLKVMKLRDYKRRPRDRGK